MGGEGGRREKESPSHEKKKPDGKSRGETPLGKGEEEESARRRSVGPAPSSEGEEMGASPLLLVGRGSLRRRKVAWASSSKARSRAEDGAARTGSPLFGAGLTSSSPLGAYLGAFLPSRKAGFFLSSGVSCGQREGRSNSGRFKGGKGLKAAAADPWSDDDDDANSHPLSSLCVNGALSGALSALSSLPLFPQPLLLLSPLCALHKGSPSLRFRRSVLEKEAHFSGIQYLGSYCRN